MNKQRVEILDSFRCIAIVSVMLFHYTYRWTYPFHPGNLYPYGDAFGPAFKYGNLGVQFFFIISGFVISYTLENTEGSLSFFKNRFIRLFPPMVMCSLVTFFVCSWADKNLFQDSQKIKDFLPSLTFINPKIWTAATGKQFDWISLSYWSLWVEVQFYIVAASLYFSNPKKFFNRSILVAVLLNLFYYIPNHFLSNYKGTPLPQELIHVLSGWDQLNTLFNIAVYFSWFTIGIIFHHLFKGNRIRLNSLTGIGVIVIFFYQFYACITWQIRIIYLVMITLFVLMVFRKEYLFFLDVPIFRRIGVVSYTIYLIHENIGVTLIHKYGGKLGNWSVLCPFILFFPVILFAELSFRLYEKRAGRFLKKILFRPGRPIAEPSVKQIAS